jgi:hypothetical protein
MDIFLLNKKDIDSKTTLHKNLSNMNIALRNMHIAHVSILRPSYTRVGLSGGISLTPVPALSISAIFRLKVYFSWCNVFHTAVSLFAQPRNSTTRKEHAVFRWTKVTAQRR